MALTALWLSVVVQSPNIQIMRISGCNLTPFVQRGSAIFFEGFAAVEMTVEVEVVVDRGMDGREFLPGLYVSEPSHRALSSSKWLV